MSPYYLVENIRKYIDNDDDNIADELGKIPNFLPQRF